MAVYTANWAVSGSEQDFSQNTYVSRGAIMVVMSFWPQKWFLSSNFDNDKMYTCGIFVIIKIGPCNPKQ